MTTNREAALFNADNVVKQLQRISAELDGKPTSLSDAVAVLQLQATLALVQATLDLSEPMRWPADG